MLINYDYRRGERRRMFLLYKFIRKVLPCKVNIYISTFQQLFTRAIELENVLNEKALHFLLFISFC